MKTLLPLLSMMLLTSLIGTAQKPELTYNKFTGEISQTRVVDMGRAPAVAFRNVRAWLTQKYSNYWEVIKVSDPDRGKIVYHGSEPVYTQGFEAFSYRVIVDLKDNKYSCTIDQVKARPTGSKVFVSSDMDFSTIYTYQKRIADIDVAKTLRKGKAEQTRLNQERSAKVTYLENLAKMHDIMAYHFNRIQWELRNAALKGEPVARR
ncbi:DUF4468 domain-containing protein [Dyadobacter pollutisoli]|uniref:DUF4468 domain-containing protein n=1 Tax=Dyadobacter pollutisoli TaxID=2910158 RepID=A0A9E8SRW6_9BACT|nr:DUF4468 domain-containing protein [Dyadobacter pollutisoli]WAC14657.1 DUF4468 domain-containing protein [Dyadobacter pollutisoli]